MFHEQDRPRALVDFVEGAAERSRSAWDPFVSPATMATVCPKPLVPYCCCLTPAVPTLTCLHHAGQASPGCARWRWQGWRRQPPRWHGEFSFAMYSIYHRRAPTPVVFPHTRKLNLSILPTAIHPERRRNGFNALTG